MSVKVSDININNLPPTISRNVARAILRVDWGTVDRWIESGKIPTINDEGERPLIPTHRFLVAMGLRSENSELIKEIQFLRQELIDLKQQIAR